MLQVLLKASLPESRVKNTTNNVEERTDGWRDEVQKLLEKPDPREYKSNDASPKVRILIYSSILVSMCTTEVQSIIAGTRLVKITCWLRIETGGIGPHRGLV